MLAPDQQSIELALHIRTVPARASPWRADLGDHQRMNGGLQTGEVAPVRRVVVPTAFIRQPGALQALASLVEERPLRLDHADPAPFASSEKDPRKDSSEMQ